MYLAYYQFEVRRPGKLVFERDTGFRKKFEINGRKSYEDFLYFHKRYVNHVRNNMKYQEEIYGRDIGTC